MKRFWLKILLLVPLPIAVIGFNWFVDPVHLRHADQYEYGIAQLILDGRRVTNISNPNEAAYIKFIVDGSKTRKDVLVFGSSRSKLIRADLFPGLSLFNNSIGGAGLVDYLAIYQMYRQKQLLPSIAVIELSPWILMRDYSSVWKTLNASKQELENQLLLTASQKATPFQIHSLDRVALSEFLSLGYFQTSFYTWLDRLSHPSKSGNTYFVWQDGTPPVGETLLTDGSAIYLERVQHPRNREQVTALAIEYAQKPAGVPVVLDPDREKVLDTFLDQLARDGVRAVLYLPPYHPKTYRLMVESPQNHIIVEEQTYFEDLARRRGLTLVGSYNPSNLGIDERVFFDGSHPTEDGVREIFAASLPGENTVRAAHGDLPDRAEITDINNPNGVEVVDNKAFFWIGSGDTCLSIRSPRDGSALISFQAEPGPSLPTTPVRSLALKTADGSSKSITLTNYPEEEIVISLKQGVNEVCLTPLDKAIPTKQANGDLRPLLVGVSDLHVKMLSADVQPDRVSLPFTLTNGWYQVEHSGADWLCWTDGHGQLEVVVAKDTPATLSGQILSAPRPNDVDVLLNGADVGSLRIDWTKWEFRNFRALDLALKAGDNTVEFISHNPAIKINTDNRALAIAVKNLSLTVPGK